MPTLIIERYHKPGGGGAGQTISGCLYVWQVFCLPDKMTCLYSHTEFQNREVDRRHQNGLYKLSKLSSAAHWQMNCLKLFYFHNSHHLIYKSRPKEEVKTQKEPRQYSEVNYRFKLSSLFLCPLCFFVFFVSLSSLFFCPLCFFSWMTSNSFCVLVVASDLWMWNRFLVDYEAILCL
jgi:hypothetical protein